MSPFESAAAAWINGALVAVLHLFIGRKALGLDWENAIT